MKTIAIVNQKGGVAKTTSTVNLGAGLCRAGKRVLLVDSDPQSNLTIWLGGKAAYTAPGNLTTLLQKEMNEEDVPHGEGILRHEEGMDYIPCDRRLGEMLSDIENSWSRETLFKRILAPYQEDYDYCLIDCSPSLGMLTINAITAADSVIIPVVPQPLPVVGLMEQLDTVRKVKRRLNPTVKVDGVLITLMDYHANVCLQNRDELLTGLSGTVHIFKSEIPKNVKVSECSALSKSIYAHDPRGKGAAAYNQFVKEVLDIGREKTRPGKIHDGRSR